MVRDRLSEFLENPNVFADTIFGFRAHRSAEDVLLQLDREILNPVECLNDKEVLALDLKGAFDNVTHDIILSHLSQNNCGHNTFQYVKQFLSDRQSYIRIQGEEHGPYQLGTRGTPQGVVLSPLLFNLAMLKLPAQLENVEGIQHALYAHDITIWTKQGSVGDTEANLQQAAEIVDAYARRCGLQCSPAKSQFVHNRPSPKCTTKIELSLPNGPITEHDQIRVLGLFIHKHRRVDTTLAKLRKVGDQLGRMVRRVSNKRGGLRFDENALEVIHRKTYKRALDLPINTSNQRLLSLVLVNTIAELQEAHLTNHYTGLSKTPSGRRLLARLHVHHPTLTEERVRIPEIWRYALHVRPLPANMTRDDHSGRRLALAEALARHYGNKHGVFYVDASGPHHGGWYTAAVVHQNTAVNGLTFKAQDITQAEELAIALAAAHHDSRVIISDSQAASRNIERGFIPYFAYRLLQGSNYLGVPASRTTIWTPAHEGLEGNEAADAAGRVFALRASPSPPVAADSDPNPAFTFEEITQHYQYGHAIFPKPCKGLTKAEERLLLRLYTKTLLCPAVQKHFDPTCTGKCPHCEEKSSDNFHMVWACQSTPHLPAIPNPTRDYLGAALLGCSDLASQKALVGRARATATANGLL
ncbi:uncharacterized protein [Dermacentor albipictus]|uniref:uncharacterized protein n=1 Tax=Dermacentor albipictus TaxID=60249 RepID=UPI0038FCCBF8